MVVAATVSCFMVEAVLLPPVDLLISIARGAGGKGCCGGGLSPREMSEEESTAGWIAGCEMSSPFAGLGTVPFECWGFTGGCGGGDVSRFADPFA